MIQENNFLIVGGGPAGLSAAIEATNAGVDVILIDDGLKLGGQLIKQTHKFFGSEMEYAGVRGFEIAGILLEQLESKDNFQVLTQTTAIGYYEDGIVTALASEEEYLKFRPKRLLVAIGATEKSLPVHNNDLPGVYGAGAVQTLMNVYGIKPGDNALMVGAGNIGLIISYQLEQAGTKVAAVVEAMPEIGGYLVHASKIRRLGIPVYTNYTLLDILGDKFVEGARICKVDANWQPIRGTEEELEVDLICLSVGLSPLIDILWQAGCRMKYIPELGGNVPLKNETMETTTSGIYVAGDSAGIEEASSAMLEGAIAGLAVAKSLKAKVPDYDTKINKLTTELNEFRNGPIGQHIKKGLDKIIKEYYA